MLAVINMYKLPNLENIFFHRIECILTRIGVNHRF